MSIGEAVVALTVVLVSTVFMFSFSVWWDRRSGITKRFEPHAHLADGAMYVHSHKDGQKPHEHQKASR